MPQYENENTFRVEDNGVVILPGRTKSTEKILVEQKMSVDDDSGLIVGETITGEDSSTTARILRSSAGVLDLVDVTGDGFIAIGDGDPPSETGETVTGGTSEETATVSSVKKMLVKTAVGPLYTPNESATAPYAEASEAGDVSYPIDLDVARFIKISQVSTGITVDIYLEQKRGTPFVSNMDEDDDPIIFPVNGNVSQIIFTFDGAGTIVVEQFETYAAAIAPTYQYVEGT